MRADAVTRRCWALSKELCRRQEVTPELRAAWEQLWADTVAGDRLARSSIRHACMVLSLGSSIAVAEGDYARSVSLLRAYFAHPRIDEAECSCRASLSCNLADSLLHLGEQAEAVAAYRQALNSEDPACARKARSFAREFVRDYCLEQEDGAQASPELTDFVEELVQRTRRSAKRRLPRIATYAELVQILNWAHARARRMPSAARGPQAGRSSQ